MAIGSGFLRRNAAAQIEVVGRCDLHWDDESVAVCGDCGQQCCERCLVTVTSIGCLCMACALVRGGIRTRHWRAV